MPILSLLILSGAYPYVQIDAVPASKKAPMALGKCPWSWQLERKFSTSRFMMLRPPCT